MTNQKILEKVANKNFDIWTFFEISKYHISQNIIISQISVSHAQGIGRTFAKNRIQLSPSVAELFAPVGVDKLLVKTVHTIGTFRNYTTYDNVNDLR